MSEGKKEKDTYKIIVDQKSYDWANPTITGADIKKLAGVDTATYDAWQDVPGPEDLLITDTQKADLTPSRVEKFFTGKKKTTEG